MEFNIGDTVLVKTINFGTFIGVIIYIRDYLYDIVPLNPSEDTVKFLLEQKRNYLWLNTPKMEKIEGKNINKQVINILYGVNINETRY